MSQPVPVPPRYALLLTVGISADEQSARGQRDVQRAHDALAREGFKVGLTSEESILLKAEQITTNREEHHPA